MNILIIKTNPFAPEGITGVVMNLYRSMDKADMHIDAVAPGRAGKVYRDIFAQNGGKIYRIDRAISHPFRYVRQLKKRIIQGKYDVVHIHGNSRTMALDLLAAKQAGCPVRIVHGHTTNCAYKALHRLMTPLFFSLGTHFVACGEKVGQFLFGKHPYTVIPNGIPVKSYAFHSVKRQKLRQELGLENKFVLCNVGKLSEGKNQAFLLEVLKLILEEKKNAHLLLVGDGPQREALEEQAKELPVTFAGVTDRVEEYLNVADAFVMPSLYEGFPLSAMEAQANGLPCFLADTITQEVNVTGNVAYLPLEATAWVTALAECADAQERSRRSAQAQEAMIAKGYDNVAISKALKTYYEQALEREGE